MNNMKYYDDTVLSKSNKKDIFFYKQNILFYILIQKFLIKLNFIILSKKFIIKKYIANF